MVDDFFTRDGRPMPTRTREISAATLGDRVQTAMSASTTTALHSNASEFQIEIVVDHDQVRCREREAAIAASPLPLRFIYSCGSINMLGSPTIIYRVHCIRLIQWSQGRAPSSRQFLHDHESNIVAGMGIRGAGISQPNDATHGLS